jgi:hypothetical protein
MSIHTIETALYERIEDANVFDATPIHLRSRPIIDDDDSYDNSPAQLKHSVPRTMEYWRRRQ